MKPRQVSPQEFAAEVRNWIAARGEALVDLYLRHTQVGARQYLLTAEDQVDQLTDLARRENRHVAVLTAFRDRYFPLRGPLDEAFAEQARAAWVDGQWYAIRDFSRHFPETLDDLGAGNTREELDGDLSQLLTKRRGLPAGFGEDPFDSEDWLDRSRAEAIQTTIETPG